MAIATYLGVVEHGQIRLCDPVALRENTKVYVVVPDAAHSQPAQIATPRLAHPE